MARTDPAHLRRRVGAELRAWRDSAPERIGRRITAVDAANELGCTQPKISQMEAGRFRLLWRDVRDLLRFYGVSAEHEHRLIEWARQSAEPSWWKPYAKVVDEWFANLVGGESEARREVNYEHAVLPGLLQTEGYARALTMASRNVRPDELELVVALREERQRRLTEDDPLELVAIIEESVLARPVGPPEVMREQLRHLLRLVERPNLTVQVLPTSAGPHAALAGRFILLEFDEFPPAVYLELTPPLGARYAADDPALTANYQQIAAETREQAMTPRESVRMIERTLDRFERGSV